MVVKHKLDAPRGGARFVLAIDATVFSWLTDTFQQVFDPPNSIILFLRFPSNQSTLCEMHFSFESAGCDRSMASDFIQNRRAIACYRSSNVDAMRTYQWDFNLAHKGRKTRTSNLSSLRSNLSQLFSTHDCL
jgi:hypothetical protein